MVRTTLPGASVEEVETQVSDVLEEAVNRVEGINELRSVSAPGQSMVIITFNLDRDIDTAAQDVRDRVGAVLRQLPDDVDPPMIFKQDNDQLAGRCRSRSSGNLSIRELTEIADKIVKVPLERSAGVGEVRIVGGLERGRSTSGSKPTAWPPTSCRSPTSATALQQQNADLPGGNVTDGHRRAHAAHDGPLHRRRAVQRPRHRDAQRRADSRPRHRPRRGRHQGAALASRG